MTERSRGDGSSDEAHAPFTHLFNTHYRPAVTFVQCQAPSADVEEIVGQAFLEVLTRWDSIDNPQAYLFTVLRNGITQHHRKRMRDNRLCEQLHAVRPRETTGDALEGKIIYDDVIAALRELPPAMREVAVMSWMLHKSPDQVAEELGKSRSTVTTQLTEAARRLRQFLTMREEER